VEVMVKRFNNNDQFGNVRNITECCDINEQYSLIKETREIMPQKESGYTEISNEVMDNLVRYRFNSQALSFIIYIIRSTWGYKEHAKKEGIETMIFTMGQVEIAKRLKISLRSLRDAIEKAVDANIILIKRFHGVKIKQGVYKTNYYMFNKNYDTWVDIRQKSNGAPSNSATDVTITDEDVNDEESE
jgi:hypothetical protein